MQPINTIASKLLPICRDVELKIVGHDRHMAEMWAWSNAHRHAHTVQALVDRYDSGTISVLNASGLSCGHQDFAIAAYLQGEGIPYRWVACESPLSPYLDNPCFKEYVERLSIGILLSDFSQPGNCYGTAGGYDAVLFTEIAEHLDHSTLLKALQELRGKVTESGELVVTTPNMLSLLNRIRFLLGTADAGLYWGDGLANLDKGLYGHIVAYDRKRMVRLLGDAGFTITHATTFNSSSRTLKIDAVRNLAMFIVDTLSLLVPDAGATLLVRAVPGDRRTVPFQI